MSLPKDGIRGREPREQGQEQEAGEHTSSILLLPTVIIRSKEEVATKRHIRQKMICFNCYVLFVAKFFLRFDPPLSFRSG